MSEVPAGQTAEELRAARDATWERAYEANRRRTAEAQQQIDDARAEPTVAERQAQIDDAQLQAGRRDPDGGKRCGHAMFVEGCRSCAWRVPIADDVVAPLPDTVTLSGAKLAAYRQLESAATAAAEAQQAMTTTGVALRDAIQAMCAAMTGVK